MSGMIEAIYDNWLAKEEEKNKREQGISISGLGKCLRRLIMSDRKYSTLPNDKYSRRTFRHGNVLEWDIEKALVAEGRLTAKQVKVSYTNPNGVVIGGSLDFIVSNPAMNCNMLVDTKTAKESSFQYLDKANQEISEDYKYQTTAYFYGKNTEGELIKDKYGLNKNILICYISKDNSLFYEPTFDAEKFKKCVDEKLDLIALAKKQKELPPEMTVWKKKVKGVYTDIPECRFPCWAIQNDSRTHKPCDCKIWCEYLPHCEVLFAKYKKTCKDLGFKEDERLK